MYTKQLRSIDGADLRLAVKKLLAQLNTVQQESQRELESLRRSVEDLTRRVAALEQG